MNGNGWMTEWRKNERDAKLQVQCSLLSAHCLMCVCNLPMAKEILRFTFLLFTVGEIWQHFRFAFFRSNFAVELAMYTIAWHVWNDNEYIEWLYLNQLTESCHRLMLSPMMQTAGGIFNDIHTGTHTHTRHSTVQHSLNGDRNPNWLWKYLKQRRQMHVCFV